MNQDFLNVKPGEAVTAEKWNQMQKAAAASQVLRGGENTRIQMTPHGTLINTKHGGGWNHPWRVVTSQKEATIYPGTVNGEYPSIKTPDNQVTRIDAKPAPRLDMVFPKVGPNGVGWIALELQLEDDYRMIKTAMVVQTDYIVGSELATNNPFFFFGLPGIGGHKVRYPLARLHYFRDSGALDIFQVAMFNLNHTCKPPNPDPDPAKSTLPRHFFFPS
jgi:hypothetical protein